MDPSKHWTWKDRLRAAVMLAAGLALLAAAPASHVIGKWSWIFH